MLVRDQYEMWETEVSLWKQGASFVVGIDEVGRGPLAGPVVACAVSLRKGTCAREKAEQSAWALIRDSKKLSEKQREEMYDFIREYFFVGVGRVSADTIDRMNILQASFFAMKQAQIQLMRTSEASLEKAVFLVDGDKEIPHVRFRQYPIIKGDGRVKCIAAASIVAKVVRDREMIVLGKEYPQYGFEKHKGYGTREHMEALRKYGPIGEHRRSFAPVRKYLRELREYGGDM